MPIAVARSARGLRKPPPFEWSPGRLAPAWRSLMRKPFVVLPIWRGGPEAAKNFALKTRFAAVQSTGISFNDRPVGPVISLTNATATQTEFAGGGYFPQTSAQAGSAVGGVTLGVVARWNAPGGSDRRLIWLSGGTTRDPGTGIAGANAGTNGLRLSVTATTGAPKAWSVGSTQYPMSSNVWVGDVNDWMLFVVARAWDGSAYTLRLLAVNLTKQTLAYEEAGGVYANVWQTGDGYVAFGGTNGDLAGAFVVEGAWTREQMLPLANDPWGPFRENRPRRSFSTVPALTSSVGMTGTAVMTPTYRAVRRGVAAFTGAGAMTPAWRAILRATAALTGVGTLTPGGAVVVPNRIPMMTGTSILTAGGVVVLPLSGVGRLERAVRAERGLLLRANPTTPPDEG